MIFLCFLNKFLKDERGTITALAGILIPVILLFCALGLDLGRAFVLKHKVQSICDAAALAGVSAVQGEFLHDELGNITGQILVVSVPLCDQYAEDTINQNIAVSDFDKQNVTVTSYHGWPLDSDDDGYLDSYHVEMTAQIKTAIVNRFLGMNEFTVTCRAQSKVKQKQL